MTHNAAVNDVWTQERIDQLKALVADGTSYLDIGRALKCSRNAAIGKAKRLGIDDTRPVQRPKVKVVKKIMTFRRDKQTAPAIVELEVRPGEPKPLGEVRGGCCWIHAAPPKRLFCGHPTVDGAWCRHHHDRVYPSRAKQAEAA